MLLTPEVAKRLQEHEIPKNLEALCQTRVLTLVQKFLDEGGLLITFPTHISLRQLDGAITHDIPYILKPTL